MKTTLKRLKDTVSETCITIILNTHRTSPDNKKDPLTLKNLIKDAETRLFADETKKDAQQLVQRLLDVEAQIDHSHNLESLILFVNEDIAEYTRLPIVVEDRVIIDNTFATRDLIRSLHYNTNYYVLVLSRQKTRLIEAFNDKVVAEIGKPFPFENTQSYPTNKAEQSNAARQTTLFAEYFNRVDKEVNKIRKEKPLPVLICSDEANYHEYLKVADEKQSIFDTFLNQNRVELKAHHIVDEAWKIVQKHTINKNHARKEELLKAVGSGRYLSDVNDIWKAISAGKVQTLFIEENLFQPGYMNADKITLVSDEERNTKGVVDDIYDEMIEANMEYGGDAVFLPKGELTKFDGFGAITRY